MKPVQFLLPESPEVFRQLPKSIAEYWDWQANASGIVKYWGRFHWVLQTFLYLREAGCDVHLVNQMPSSGCVVTHRDCVEYSFRPNRDLFLVVMLVDRLVPHPFADLHVVHNPVQRLPYGLDSMFIPPWPQIGLLPRAAERQQRFETLAYFGYPENLDPQIADADFRAAIADLGMTLFIPDPKDWHDFTQVDAIMAIRNFGRDDPHLNRPALKLFNAWLAEVPAILGHETACRSQGQPGRDYLESTTPTELLAALRRLRDDQALRLQIVASGKLRVSDYTPARTVERWRDFFETEVEPMCQARKTDGFGRARRRLAGAVLERLLWRQPGRFGVRDSRP
jgi:hypothetical protein